MAYLHAYYSIDEENHGDQQTDIGQSLWGDADRQV